MAPHGVNVNVGGIPDPSTVGQRSAGSQEVMSQIIKMIPTGRIGKPAESPTWWLFLEATNQLHHRTCIVSDGGYTLP
jgi:hypothetical protein